MTLEIVLGIWLIGGLVLGGLSFFSMMILPGSSRDDILPSVALSLGVVILWPLLAFSFCLEEFLNKIQRSLKKEQSESIINWSANTD